MDRTELYRVSTQILENIINDEKNDNNILFDMDIWGISDLIRATAHAREMVK